MRYVKEYTVQEQQRRMRELEAKHAKVIWWAIVVLSLMVLFTIVLKG